jgi:hypothetical protein
MPLPDGRGNKARTYSDQCQGQARSAPTGRFDHARSRGHGDLSPGRNSFPVDEKRLDSAWR